MRSYDLTPLYRSTVGFDRVFDLLENISSAKAETGGYPPYNIERVAENDYRISLAVAGFGEDDIEIEVHENELKVIGTKSDSDDGRQFLHQGIAGRAFERRFQLAEHVQVAGASLENGLLNLDLHRNIPEAKKPRRIAINGQNVSQLNVRKETDAA